MPGAQYPHLVVAGGKDGNLYVLNRDNLGGIGGELLKYQVTDTQHQGRSGRVHDGDGDLRRAPHRGRAPAPAARTNPQGNMVVLKITPEPDGGATTAWCSTQNDLASPMVTTTDGTSNPIVWNADSKPVRVERRHRRGDRRRHEHRDVDRGPAVEHAHRRQGPHRRRRERAALRVHAVRNGPKYWRSPLRSGLALLVLPLVPLACDSHGTVVSPPVGASVLMYHDHINRDGYFQDPLLAGATSVALDPTFSATSRTTSGPRRSTWTAAWAAMARTTSRPRATTSTPSTRRARPPGPRPRASASRPPARAACIRSPGCAATSPRSASLARPPSISRRGSWSSTP